MDYGLNYGYYQPNMFFPMMDFSGMQNYMSYYPQYLSVFTPQTTAQVASQQQVAQQQAKVEVKEEPKKEIPFNKEIFAMTKDGTKTKMKILEATPEKMKEYEKAYNKDNIMKTCGAIGACLAIAGLAAFVGPKVFNAMKLKDGNVLKELFASGDKVADAALSGVLLGVVPGAFIANSIEESVGKGLDKKVFGEEADLIIEKR